MQNFEFNPHLLEACFQLGRLDLCHVLLMNNASVPWFILVPETTTIELCDLDADTHSRLFGEVNLVARMVRAHYEIDKLNIASLGNIVPQMHLHVVGRSAGDYAWPGGVWGVANVAKYGPEDVASIRVVAANGLGERFRPYG